jgi:hypothetical protein
MATKIYSGLFEYEEVTACWDGVIHFEGVKLRKKFPRKYEGSTDYLCVALDPMTGDVFMYSDTDINIEYVSESVSLSDWVSYKPLSRTDSSSYRFVTSGVF